MVLANLLGSHLSFLHLGLAAIYELTNGSQSSYMSVWDLINERLAAIYEIPDAHI
jgi:hypothetical protein